MYTRLLLYYFTGTGNTRRVANWLAEDAEARGLDVQIQEVTGLRALCVDLRPGDLLGLLSPTIGFSPAWQMIRFALSLPRGNGAHGFSLFTVGSLKIGSIYLPGFEGFAAMLLALILRLKGYRVRGANGVDMPANWTTIHPGLRRDDCQVIYTRAKTRSLTILGRLLEGKTDYRGPVLILTGVLLLPLSIAFSIFGRFFLAKMYYPSVDCSACGLCARTCPVSAIKLKGGPKPSPFWTYDCQSCMRCMNVCPNRAVEASYPLAVLMIWVGNMPVTVIVLKAIAPALIGTPAEWLIRYPYNLITMAAVYFLFILLLRWLPFVNRLLTRLTPTHYYRRYRLED